LRIEQNWSLYNAKIMTVSSGGSYPAAHLFTHVFNDSINEGNDDPKLPPGKRMRVTAGLVGDSTVDVSSSGKEPAANAEEDNFGEDEGSKGVATPQVEDVKLELAEEQDWETSSQLGLSPAIFDEASLALPPPPPLPEA